MKCGKPEFLGTNDEATASELWLQLTVELLCAALPQ